MSVYITLQFSKAMSYTRGEICTNTSYNIYVQDTHTYVYRFVELHLEFLLRPGSRKKCFYCKR